MKDNAFGYPAREKVQEFGDNKSVPLHADPPRRRKRRNFPDQYSNLQLVKSHSDDVDMSPSPSSGNYERRGHRTRKKSYSDPDALIREYSRNSPRSRNRSNKYRNDNDLYPQGNEVVYQSKYSQTVSRRQDMEKLVMIRDRNQQTKYKKRKMRSAGNIMGHSSEYAAKSNPGSINVGDHVSLTGHREVCSECQLFLDLTFIRKPQ